MFDDDDDDDDAEERMMTMVDEDVDLLLLVVTEDARRLVFSDMLRPCADVTTWVLLTVWPDSDVSLGLLLALMITTLPNTLAGLAATDMVDDLVTATVVGFPSNTDLLIDTLGFLSSNVGGLTMLLSLGCAVSGLLLVCNVMTCLIGCCCFVVVETTVAGRLRGRPRLRGDTTCNVSPGDDDAGFLFVSSTSRHQINESQLSFH